MVTNREKHINNASNKELAKILAKSLDRCNFCCLNPEVCDGCLSQCEKRIAYWLSQEVEEDYVYIPNIGKIPKTDKTKMPPSMDDIKSLLENNRDYCLLVKEIVELQERVKELEKCSKCPKNNDIQLSDYSYGSIEKDKTADEMFKDLGYEKLEDGYSYKNKNDEIICISKQGYKYLKILARYIGGAVLNFITESEDKAIHKKIAELRLSKEKHIVGDIVDGKVLCGDGIWRDYR